MAQSIEELMEQTRELERREGPQRLFLSLVTHQDNGIATYASGVVDFKAGNLDLAEGVAGAPRHPDRVFTNPDTPLRYHFSDRIQAIGGPGGGGLGGDIQQPFLATFTDQLGFRLSRGGIPAGFGPWEATFTLLSHGNASFSVTLEPQANLLVGVGAPVGNLTNQALYSIALAPYRPL
jgi:hypothetical protein